MSTNRKVLITGARAPITLHLARLFKDADWTVYTADSIPLHLCSHSRAVEQNFYLPKPNQDLQGFISELERILREYQIDFLLPTCEEIFYVAMGRERLARLCQVFCTEIGVLHRLHNKYEFNQFLQELPSGVVGVPKTRIVTSMAELRELTKKEEVFGANSALVLKPVYSRFGTQVYFLKQDQLTIPEITISPQSPWVLQEFIAGRLFCTYSIAQQGQLTAHAVYESTVTLDQGASIYFEHVEEPGIYEVVTEIAKRLHFNGQLAFDIIVGEDGQLYPIECNPRGTSGIHLFDRTLIDAFELELSESVGPKGVEQNILNPDQIRETISDIATPAQIVSQKKKVIFPKADQRMMIGLAMLIVGFKNKGLFQKKWWRLFTHSKDVIFDWADLPPFLYQFAVYADFFKESLRQKKTIQELTTGDIEWNGLFYQIDH